VTAVVVAVAGVLGLLVGAVVNRAAGRFPWTSSDEAPDRRTIAVAVRAPVVELATAVLFALVAWRFGASWELPAFLLFAAVAVLLTVIDLRHRLLPNRVILPALAAGAVLLTVAATAGDAWPALLRATLGAAVLFVVFLVLALVSPRSLGMGDVKLAALVGLFLGWIGWGAVVVGGAAGFVVQALLAVVLLASRRIGLRGELPFGPAMLVGAAVAIGWSHLLVT
jgi:leader peptidase (prepilin peptidase) / N-methyltransferase